MQLGQAIRSIHLRDQHLSYRLRTDERETGSQRNLNSEPCYSRNFVERFAWRSNVSSCIITHYELYIKMTNKDRQVDMLVDSIEPFNDLVLKLSAQKVWKAESTAG